MAAKKPNKQRKPSTISQAPPPPSTIRGGYSSIKSKQPDWNFWNRLPVLSIHECVSLLINVEPGTHVEHKLVQRKNRVYRLVRSYQEAGELASDENIAPSEFISWAKSAGEVIPKEWQPINQALPKKELQKSKISIDVLRRREALDAAKEMRSSDQFKTPTSLVKEVIPFMQKEYAKSGRFPNCCKTELDVENLARSINRGGAGPLIKDEEYLAAEDVPQAAS